MLPLSALRQTITVARQTQTGRGTTVTPVAEGVPAQVQQHLKVTAGQDGPISVVTTTLFVRPNVDLRAHDKVTLASGHVVEVHDIKIVNGPNGQPSHVEAVGW